MKHKCFLCVAIKTTACALKRALPYDIAHVLEDKAGSRWTAAGIRASYTTVVVREQVFSHLRTAHTSVTHFAPEHFFLSPTRFFTITVVLLRVLISLNIQR